MGAWGSGAFENDGAMDWLAELDEDGISAIRSALKTAATTKADAYLDSDDAFAAVAAAEFIAAALSGSATRIVKSHQAMALALSKQIVESDRLQALAALVRLRGENSELSELWGKGSKWHQDVAALEAVLSVSARDRKNEEREKNPKKLKRR